MDQIRRSQRSSNSNLSTLAIQERQAMLHTAKREYTLRQDKALMKKSTNTKLPQLQIAILHENIVITANTGMYEVLKSSLSNFILHMDKKKFIVQATEIKDRSMLNVEAQIKVTEIASGSSYTMNMYNTTNKILVNGKLHKKFLDDLSNLINSDTCKKGKELNQQLKKALLVAQDTDPMITGASGGSHNQKVIKDQETDHDDET